MLADEDAPSQQDLAHRLGINRTIMVKLLDRLQRIGYVTRTRNPANRRTYVLSVTDEGRAALKDMRQAAADRDARLTAPLTPPERHRLNELLGRLVAHDERSTIPSTEHLIAQAHYRLRRSVTTGWRTTACAPGTSACCPPWSGSVPAPSSDSPGTCTSPNRPPRR
ncbi:MarR family winged helix-turn-helix transcriptional regulator [Streptosporangium lutulentum]